MQCLAHTIALFPRAADERNSQSGSTHRCSLFDKSARGFSLDLFICHFNIFYYKIFSTYFIIYIYFSIKDVGLAITPHIV